MRRKLPGQLIPLAHGSCRKFWGFRSHSWRARLDAARAKTCDALLRVAMDVWLLVHQLKVQGLRHVVRGEVRQSTSETNKAITSSRPQPTDYRVELDLQL